MAKTYKPAFAFLRSKFICPKCTLHFANSSAVRGSQRGLYSHSDLDLNPGFSTFPSSDLGQVSPTVSLSLLAWKSQVFNRSSKSGEKRSRKSPYLWLPIDCPGGLLSTHQLKRKLSYAAPLLCILLQILRLTPSTSPNLFQTTLISSGSTEVILVSLLLLFFLQQPGSSSLPLRHLPGLLPHSTSPGRCSNVISSQGLS